MGQLPLELSLSKHAHFDSFVADDNRAVVVHLRAASAGQRRDSIWLWGPASVGKTHLLQAACRGAGESGLRTMYLSLAAVADPDSLDGLAALELLALDDIDRRAADADWQQPLFKLFNEFGAAPGTLVVAASTPPAAAGFTLPDLASRAAAAAVYRLNALDDDGRLRVLMRHARIRGLDLDTATATYLFTRVRRDIDALCAWLDRIDHASLAAQRRVTIPFIRDLLREKGSDPKGSDPSAG